MDAGKQKVLICWLNAVAAKLGLSAITTFSKLRDGLLLSQLAQIYWY